MRAILLLLLALATGPAVAQPERKVAKVGVVLYYDEQVARRAGLVVETLRERGWIEGHNVQYFFRSAERNLEGIEELVRMPVDVLVVFGNDIAREAVKRSRTIQVVVGTADYPIESGLVPSLSRPGGQITGVNNWVGRSLDAKRLALLKEALPILSRVAVVGPRWMREWPETQAAAKALGIELIDIGIGTPPTELEKTAAYSVRSAPS